VSQASVTVLRRPAAASLAELAARLRAPLEAIGCERAVAFGSYARGTADGYADLDLVLVLPTDLPPLERGQLVRPVVEALPLAVDLLITTPEEYRRGLERGHGVFDAIAREGVTIYERPGG
jgi:predicted nucleotidyltransferase